MTVQQVAIASILTSLGTVLGCHCLSRAVVGQPGSAQLSLSGCLAEAVSIGGGADAAAAQGGVQVQRLGAVQC
jgi:hypothetical protein